MKYLLPNGIGDAVWAIHKVQSIQKRLDPSGSIHISLSCSDRNILQDRALDFMRRFDFISSVEMKLNYGLLNNYGTDRPPFTPGGYYDYLEDGIYEFKGEKYCVLIPNAPLERGIRLEKWLPQYEINWNIFENFHITPKERIYGNTILSKLGPYVVFYPGPIQGNTVEGHNRNMLWKPQEWVELGERIYREFKLPIVVVGAEYDHDYYTHMLLPRLNGSTLHWIDLIGKTNLGELFALTSNAKFLISYQAGVGIVSTLLKVPTAMWWRPRGDSISQSGFLSFEEDMSVSWVPPSILESGSYLPLIYGREKVEDILNEIVRREWIA
jgi:hypothetical protein